MILPMLANEKNDLILPFLSFVPLNFVWFSLFILKKSFYENFCGSLSMP
jgi:uncharacterized membrane protein YqhA